MDGIQSALESLKKARLALDERGPIGPADLDSGEDWAEFVAARAVVESIIGAFIWEKAGMCVRVDVSHVFIPKEPSDVE